MTVLSKISNKINDWVTARGIERSHSKLYYDIYKPTIKTVEQEVAFILKALNLPSRASILDLGCGFGRHSIELAKRGHEVLGVDISSELLEIAEDTSRKENVDTKFVREDISKLNFVNQFDAVIMMLNVFGLMSDRDNQKVLRRASEALKRKGKIFIDLRNPERFIKGDLYPNPDKTDGLTVWTENYYDSSKKRVLVVRHADKDGKRHDYFFSARLYSRAEIKVLFEKNDLKLLRFYGDFEGNDYNKKNSPRLIAVGEKTVTNEA